VMIRLLPLAYSVVFLRCSSRVPDVHG
jgi:hypothetical protein